MINTGYLILLHCLDIAVQLHVTVKYHIYIDCHDIAEILLKYNEI